MRAKIWGILGIALGLILPGNSFNYGFPQESVFPLGTVGCLFTNQLCGIEEVCIDDLLFGNCQRLDKNQDLHQYRLREDELSNLEGHIIHLISDGYTWQDYYTQCVLQNALLASRTQLPFRRSMCKLDSDGAKVRGDMGQYLEQVFKNYYDTYKPSGTSPEVKREGEDGDIIRVHKYFEKEPGGPQLGFPEDLSEEDKMNLMEDLRFLGADNISLKDVQALQYYLDSIRKGDGRLGSLYEDEAGRDFNLRTAREFGLDSDSGSQEFRYENKEWPEEEDLSQWSSYDQAPASYESRVSYPYDAEKEEILNKLKSGEITTSSLSDEQITDLVNYISQRLPSDSKSEEENDWPMESEEKSKAEDDWTDSRPMENKFVGTEDMMGNWGEGTGERAREDQNYVPPENSAQNKIADAESVSSKGSDGEVGNLEPHEEEEASMKDKKNVETMLSLTTKPRISPTVSSSTQDTSSNTKKPIETDVYWIQVGGKLNGEQAQKIEMMIAKALDEEHANIRITSAERDEDNGRLTIRINTTDPNVPFKKIIESIKDEVQKELSLGITDVGIGNNANPVSLRVSDDRYIVLSFVLCGCIAGILLASVIIFLIRRNSRSKQKLAQLSSGPTGEGNEPSQDYQDLCRQRMQGKTTEKPEPLHAASRIGSMSGEQVRSPSSRSSTSSWSEEPVTSNMDISTGHIVLSYMEDHLKNKDRLDREWEGLCTYEADPSNTNIANDAANIRKNRYSDTVPYDHSRVILSTNCNASSSDYVNASTITDHDPRNPAYIATQGPLPHTVADFWQMVWEQGSVVIVMLTRLTENGEAMCYRYWPEEGSDLYHIYEVHLVSEHIWCDDYLVRSFYLKNLQTNETRTVTQFHFLTWPDLDVPKSIKALLDFRRKVNKSYRGRSCPIVVHCSDGCGRTGTYCLIDMVLNRMAKGAKEIDIAATLEHIRDQRKNMVKTKEQFQFALAAVAEEVHAILKALPQ